MGNLSDKIIKETKLREMVKEMTGKYCPIMKGECQTNCVHFSGGHVFGTGEGYSIRSPSCKLWK